MSGSRIAEWLESRAGSFEAGRAHDENLAYLLGEHYVPARGWDLSRDVFRSMVTALAEVDECLLIRAIVPLVEREELAIGAIDAAAIADQLDVFAPPAIVVMPPAFAAYDERQFEAYEIALTLGDSSLPGIARYQAIRYLAFDPRGPWQRCVTLEAQSAACR